MFNLFNADKTFQLFFSTLHQVFPTIRLYKFSRQLEEIQFCVIKQIAMNKTEHIHNGYFSFLSYLSIGFAMCTITGLAVHTGLTDPAACETASIADKTSQAVTADRFDYLFQ